ncbi:MAG TPA: DUF1631 family protein, partial [Pseudomonadales bacterium]|nr:DUF1631 family protein [Pseudomonadales bacterium]
MSEDPLQRIKPENIAAALKGFYTPPKPGAQLVEGDALIELLHKLPSLSTSNHVDPILVQVQRHHRGTSFNPADHATLAFVDDTITQVLSQTDLDFRIEAFVRDLAPFVAAIALKDGVTALTHPQKVLSLIDLLIRECIGWSEDLGILGDQFMEKVETIVSPLISAKTNVDTCLDELETLFGKEDPIFEKMEQRLVDSELKVLAGEKSKFYAAELLNKQMAGKQLPLFIIFMLQGSWYEFLQDVFIHYGQKSKEWQNATKLSDALTWSLQADPGDAGRHATLMTSLPDRVKAFCATMKFDTEQVEACLADVEEEYTKIRENEASDPCDFELLEVDSSMGEPNQKIDLKTMKTIEAFGAGQWFLYDDPNEPEEKVARIKLILNWNDTERLLFTNHNRRKVMHMSYGQLSTHLGDNSMRSLTPKDDAHTIIRSHLLTVIQGIQQQKKKEVQIEEVAQRKEVSQEYLAERKQALVQALEQHKQQAELKRKRAMILRQKAEQKLQAATDAVQSLKVEAWVKLPIMEGTLTPCRLVAIIPGANKFIFANRAGIKVAEYTGGQLSHMIITENSEILDTGAEFANVLASVVTGLREDRNK